ncbi:hypothetical protein F511_03531 [Dorcoceras hygrometricum]|uniref:Uncharacterized protein n=1 Tax=Dorcoceras hygrometricum TaxID=472368 RepID=A0A2Z7AC68_9LAMI|nr:hypothetical protein F511_03531 [Dorcoceras hygrometricum]
MYVTRPLSQLRKFPELVSESPEGPNSGYLVIQDEESETYSLLGLFKNHTLKELPFPQNKELTYTTSDSRSIRNVFYLFFFKVIFRALIQIELVALHDRSHTSINDAKPRQCDPRNIYQQFWIGPYESVFTTRGYFMAKSVASDGFPPSFLRRKGWTMHMKTPKDFNLGRAQGVDCQLRARLPVLPHLSLPRSEPVVVGKWYCPFIFVKDDRLTDQMESSMYYEMTLEQRWERIFTCQNNAGNLVAIDVILENEEVFVLRTKGVMNERNTVDGIVWFASSGNLGGQTSFGLRVEVVQRMKWEQERGGWIGGEENEVKIKRTEEYKEGGQWREFGCYVLVERFKLKRMDGSLAMEYDFKHLHQIKSLWE